MVAKKKTSPVPAGKPEQTPESGDPISVELRNAREAKGLSFSDLHRLTDISRTTLHDYESGRSKPGARELIKLCHVLEVSPNRILLGTEDPFAGSGGVLVSLVRLARTKPAMAAVFSAFLVPLAAAILARVGSDTLLALSALGDEALRSRDPEAFRYLSMIIAECERVDPKALMQMSEEERQKVFMEIHRKVGPPPASFQPPQ